MKEQRSKLKEYTPTVTETLKYEVPIPKGINGARKPEKEQTQAEA